MIFFELQTDFGEPLPLSSIQWLKNRLSPPSLEISKYASDPDFSISL